MEHPKGDETCNASSKVVTMVGFYKWKCVNDFNVFISMFPESWEIFEFLKVVLWNEFMILNHGERFPKPQRNGPSVGE